jgi:hypothetical protein
MKFRWVGRHLQDFVGGKTIEPGGFVNLTKEEVEDPHTQAVLDTG